MAEQQNNPQTDLSALLRFVQTQQQQQCSYVPQPPEVIQPQRNEQVQDFAVEEQELSLEEHDLEEFEVTESYNVESFIEAIRDYVCIWNTSLRSHHELTKRKVSWETLALRFGKTEDFLKNQWKNLRDALKKCLVKREQQTKSGAGAQSLATCKYFKQLEFIHDKIMNKKTQSNLVLDNSPIEIGESPSSSDSLPSPSPSQTNNLQSPSPPPSQVNNLHPPSCTQVRHLNAQKENDSRNVKLRPPTYVKRKRREEISDQIDCVLLKTLNDMKETPKEIQNMQQNTGENLDADFMFCNSLIPILKKLPAKKNGLAKLKIQGILYQIEFDDEV